MSIEYNEGLYRCQILDQGLSESKTKNAQIWLKIRPVESLSPEDEGIQLPTGDRMVYWTITEKTIGFVTDKLIALGFTGESFRQLDLSHQNPESFVGQTEDFYCKHETYEGKEREKWDLSRGDTAIKPLEESSARKLDALFGRTLKDRVRAAPKRSAREGNNELQDFSEEQAAAVGEDDIAF